MIQSRAFALLLLAFRFHFLTYALDTEEAMAAIYKAAYVSLHVRKSNRAAIGLYRDTLGFEVHNIEKAYCE